MPIKVQNFELSIAFAVLKNGYIIEGKKALLTTFYSCGGYVQPRNLATLAFATPSVVIQPSR
jgi:hypothetical protein